MNPFATSQPLVIEPPRVAVGVGDDAEQLEVELRIRQGDRSAAIQSRFTGLAPIAPPLALEAGLAVALVPAMKLGSPLRIEGCIDREVLAGARRFQEIFSSWYPEFQPIPIHAEGGERAGGAAAEDGRGAGLFFSGGLDSMYSLVKNQRDVTHAIFVHGCDVPLANTAHRAVVSARLREAAEGFGVRLVEVETDLTDFSDRYAHWGYHYHGCGLAAVGMLAGGSLRKVLISSSYPYSKMVPWGSTFMTDPLWSCSRFAVVNDGGEHNRFGKTRAIAAEPLALEHLRVCFENPDGGYNCGRCEKCYRTMVSLRLCGALDRCPAFDRPLDLERMLEDQEVLKAANAMAAWGVLRDEAERQGRDTELIATLQELMRRGCYFKLVRDFARMKRDITASPPWHESLPKFRSCLWDSLHANDPEWLAEKMLKGLPEIRERAFASLWKHDRRWFRRQYRSARMKRLRQRMARLLWKGRGGSAS